MTVVSGGRPLRVCIEQGCHTLTSGVRCAACERERSTRPKPQGMTGESLYRLYRTVAWRRLREALTQQNPWCAECLKKNINNPWDELDHIVPHRGNLDLFWDRDNLQGLCRTCHANKTWREERADGH